MCSANALVVPDGKKEAGAPYVAGLGLLINWVDKGFVTISVIGLLSYLANQPNQQITDQFFPTCLPTKKRSTPALEGPDQVKKYR